MATRLLLLLLRLAISRRGNFDALFLLVLLRKLNTFAILIFLTAGPIHLPVEFIAYSEDVVDVCNRHQTAHHMFADDQQLYLLTTISSAAAAKGRQLACINDVRM
jgi:hypothetical protein